MPHHHPPRPVSPQTGGHGAVASADARAEDSGGATSAIRMVTDALTAKCVRGLLDLHDQAFCAAHPRDCEEWQAAAYRLRRACACPDAAVARTPADVLALCADLLLLTDPDEGCAASTARTRGPAGQYPAEAGGSIGEESTLLGGIREAAWCVVLAPLEE